MAKKMEQIIAEAAEAYKRAARPYHKYNVSPAEQRTYKGRVYASLRECARAKELDRLVEIGEVAWWLPQVLIPLGEDESWRIDFVVAIRAKTVYSVRGTFELLVIHGEDPKGAKLGLAKKRKLWNKYGPFELRIMYKDGVVEIFEGKKK